MPHISSVNRVAIWWNGQFCSTIVPLGSQRGSKPCAASTSTMTSRRAASACSSSSKPGAHLLAQSLTFGPRHGVQGGGDVDSVGARPVDRRGEQPCDQPVVTRRKGHLDIATSTAIQLRRPSRSRSLAAREAPVVDIQQSIGRQSVEVVCRGSSFQADGVGRRVATHPRSGRRDVLVERSSGRLAERARSRPARRAAPTPSRPHPPVPACSCTGDPTVGGSERRRDAAASTPRR